MTRWIWVLGVGVALTTGCATATEDDVSTSANEDDWGASSEALRGTRTPALPREVARRLRDPRPLTEAELDRVYAVDHDIRVGRGRRVHATEHFSLRSWLTWPRRAAILLPGTVVTSSFYNLDVDGYRFAETLAREGFFVFAIDYEGTGQSTFPDDGLSATHDTLVTSARRVVRYIRRVRWVRRVDAIGESNGGAVAAELCRDRRRVRSCVLSSMLYREGTPFFQGVFLNPAFLAFLRSQPNGYLDVTPDLYFNIISRASPDVATAVLATQPGVYAVAPLLEPTVLPWFDASRARVPAIIIQGTEDNIATQADADNLAAHYGSARGAGGVATVFRIDGAGHIPRIEAGPNEIWTQTVLDFLTAP